MVLYASGVLLETFRQAIFHENIIPPFGREEGCFQCAFAPNSFQDAWQVELQTIGSTQYEAYQIEDDGTLMSRDGSVIPELSTYLSNNFDASHVRSAIVHVQGKGQQKVVAFIAPSGIQSQIPCIFNDHQGYDRILQYKQPDVYTDTPASNIYVKEMRADHHVIAHAKGINHGARIGAFLPMPYNDLSRKRFSRVKSFNFCISRHDVLCTILDEAVPICLVNHELSTQEVSQLIDFLFRKQPILDHHSVFLACPIDKPDISLHTSQKDHDTIVLPQVASIVHCHLVTKSSLFINLGLRMVMFLDASAMAFNWQSMNILTLFFSCLGNWKSLIFFKQHRRGILLRHGKLSLHCQIPSDFLMNLSDRFCPRKKTNLCLLKQLVLSESLDALLLRRLYIIVIQCQLANRVSRSLIEIRSYLPPPLAQTLHLHVKMRSLSLHPELLKNP